MQRADLENRFVDFSVGIIEITKTLDKDLTGQYYGGQLLRSGGSPALHYGEALGAESTKDFIHKLSIALKELRETYNNLKIIKRAALTPNTARLNALLIECNELISIIYDTIKTSRKKLASS